GISGIMMGCRLLDAGLDVVILEKALRPGGTWRDNIYPGAACDIPSHLYCWSGQLNPEWTSRYASSGEILRYIDQIVEDHRLGPHILCGSEVAAASWDGRLWSISTLDGRNFEVDVVISATGVLHHPAFPDIEGLDGFAGSILHTAQWREDI